MYEQTRKETGWTCTDALARMMAGDSAESVAARMTAGLCKCVCDYYDPDDLTDVQKVALKALRIAARPMMTPEKAPTYQPAMKPTRAQRTGRTTSPDYED